MTDDDFEGTNTQTPVFKSTAKNNRVTIAEDKILQEESVDWDFDFSLYDDQDKSDMVSQLRGLQEKNTIAINIYRKKFADFENDNERLAQLKTKMSAYSIKVEARTQDIQMLWGLYGALSEGWDLISPIIGQLHYDQITSVKCRCLKLITQHKGGRIPGKVHNNLLFYKKIFYKLMQITGFGFPVEKVGSFRSHAEGKIIQ